MNTNIDYRSFLHELFDTKPDNAFINIWTLAGKKNRSNWFTDIDVAADYIDTIIHCDIEIYIQPGFCYSNLGPRRRGKSIDIGGLPGFFMDIDFRTKDKPNCPPTLKEALALVEGFGYDPTIIIFTGNGIHSWWIFKECWEFGPGENKKATDLSKRLQATIKQRAAKKGWKLDSTHNVDRLMRLPGTFNLKDPNNKKQTRIEKNSGLKFEDPFEFSEWTLSKSQIKTSANISHTQISKISKDILIDKHTDPPPDKMDDLLEIDEKFRATWGHKRHDMSDESPSAYALSLANVAAAANWNDQEITNLITSFYRRHKIDLKKLHPKKIALTIGKARAMVDEQIIKEFAEEVMPVQGTEYEKIMDPDGKLARNAVCKILKMEILRLVQFEQEEKSAFLMFIKPDALCPKGQIPFKTVAQLMEYKPFTLRVWEKSRRIIELSNKNWKYCRANWAKFMNVVEAGPITAEDRMKSWVESYLQDKNEIKMSESLIDSEPFVHQGHWYIYGDKFYNWSWQNVSQTEGLQRTDLDFSIIGSKKKRFTPPNPDNPSKKKNIHPWQIPHGVLAPSMGIPNCKHCADAGCRECKPDIEL